MTTAATFHTDPSSERWIELDQHGVHALLATHPVERGVYKAYLRDAGLPTPPPLARIGPPMAPVTDVSHVDAVAYCEWLGRREGRTYRLPTVAELLELAAEAEEEGISDEVWPHQRGHRFEVRGGMKEMFLCEWTCETEETPAQPGQPSRTLGSIFYPPWLRHQSHSYHAQAHLAATEGFSFVTFRLAYARIG